ncbi:MAG: GHKL domain-containing protein [Bacilli bacterium]
MGKIITKRTIIVNVFFFVSLLLVEEFTYTLVSVFMYRVMHIENILTIKNLLLIVISKSIIIFLYRWLKSFLFEKNYNVLEMHQIKILLSSLILLVICIINIALAAKTDNAIICVVSTLLCLFIYLYLYNLSNKLNSTVMLKKKIESQSLLVDRISKNYISLLEKYKTDRKVIHDFKKELNILKSTYEYDIDKGNILNNKIIDNINSKIQIKVKDISILSIILDDYTELCAAKEINFVISNRLDRISFIDDLDWITLLANLLDNAIENIDKENPNIFIKLFNREDFIIIDIENNFLGDVNVINNFIETKKSNYLNHGYGLENIKYIIKKYNGDFNIETNNYIFKFNITIPIQ